MLLRFLIFKIMPLGFLIYGIYMYQSQMLDYYYKSKDFIVTVRTEAEMSSIRKLIKLAIDNEEKIGDIREFLKKRVITRGKKSYEDYWGTAYRLEKDFYDNSYVFYSCGPDKYCGSEDDIVVKIK